MKTLRLLFLMFVLFVSITAKAQAPQLFITPLNLNGLHQTTYSLGQTDSLLVRVGNFGGPFTGVINFRYSINGQGMDTSSNAFSGLEYAMPFDSLKFGDSITRMIYFHFTGPVFNIGPSVVVIWPWSNQAQHSIDSIKGNLIIVSNPDTLSINQNALVFAFPPPSDTVHLGDTVSKIIHIFNFGDSIFNQVINFDYSINGVTYAGSDSSAISSGQFVSQINPGGSAAKLLSFNFSQPHFAPGPSVVVIWPKAFNNTITGDSASVVIYILNPSAINEVDADQAIAYMANQQLIVASMARVKEFKIYNLEGAVILQREITNYATIPLQPYASGIYFAELTLADNSRKVFKLYNPPSVR